jgi:hypothetical protein
MLIRGNNKGFALVITMLFAMIALALTGALLYMVTQSTLMTGIGQRYATALDAAKGSLEITNIFIRDYPDTLTPASGTTPTLSCTYEKIQNETYKWVTNCTANDSIDSVASIIAFPDVIIVFGIYTTYVKIVNMRFTKTASGTDCESGCSYYTINAYTENTSNRKENTHMTTIYMTTE